MEQFHVQHSQWVALAMFGGVMLVCFVVLFHLAMGRPRRDRDDPVARGPMLGPGFARWLRVTFPWVLVLTFVGTAGLWLVYVLVRHYYPPNW